MLCVLLPTFKLVLQQTRLLPVAERCCRSTLGKCAKLLFYSFCSNVSKQVVCFCCSFKPQLFKIKEGCSGLVNVTET